MFAISYLKMAAAPHFDMQIKLLMIGDSGKPSLPLPWCFPIFYVIHPLFNQVWEKLVCC
jgi:hypothetical protein